MLLPWLFTMIENDGVIRGCCQCENDLGNVYERNFAELWTAGLSPVPAGLPAASRARPVDKCPCKTACTPRGTGCSTALSHRCSARPPETTPRSARS